MARIIGIDLGHHAVRLAVLEGNFGRYQFSRFIEAPVAPGPATASLEARLAALTVAREQLGPGGPDTFAATFPADRASVRTVTLPFTDRAQIDKTLRFEVEGLVPFDLDEMVLADRVMAGRPAEGKGADGKAEAKSTETQVFCALAPKAEVAALLSGLHGAGADPRLLMLDTDLYDTFASDGVQAVIDIGYTRTLVSVCRDGHVIASRGIDRGTRDLVWAVAHQLGVDEATAERAVRQTGLREASAAAGWAGAVDPTADADLIDVDGWTDEEPTGPSMRPPTEVPNLHQQPGQPPVADVVRDTIAPLLTELRASLISVEDTLGLSIDEVLVAGAGSALPGLRELLVTVLGVAVNPVRVTEAEGQPVPERFALAAAVSRRLATGKGRHIDLRQAEFAFKGDLNALGNILRYGALAAAALLLAGVGFFGWRTMQLRGEIADAEAKLGEVVLAAVPDADPERLKDPSVATAIMTERAAEAAAQVEALGGLISTEPPTLTLLSDIASSVPPHTETKLDVTELSLAKSTISLKIDTTGFEAAANIETALKRNARFKTATKSDEKKYKDGVRFSITIPLDSDEAQEG
ncbi:MAG: hypothetical protein RL071_4869 [Pseudomonadota bacterium]